MGFDGEKADGIDNEQLYVPRVTHAAHRANHWSLVDKVNSLPSTSVHVWLSLPSCWAWHSQGRGTRR
jgi:hypothetical protein